MTGEELLKKLQAMPEEERKFRVKFYNPKYEIYEEVSKISIIEDYRTNIEFILLNEEW